MNLTLIAALVSAGVAGLAGWGAAWTLQGRTIDALRMEAKDERIAIYRANRVALERATGQITAAQAGAQSRAAVLASERDSVRGAADGLRDASTAALRASGAALAACSHITAAYDLVLAESREFIQEVVADVGKRISEGQALSEGWPR